MEIWADINGNISPYPAGVFIPKPKKPPKLSKGKRRKELMKNIYYGKPCHYCGVELNKDNFTIDHVIPRSKGGKNTKANKVGACRACNQEKGSMSAKEYKTLLYLRKSLYKGVQDGI